MAHLVENPFYNALINAENSTEKILEIWKHLLSEGVSGFQNRNLMSVVCKRGDINLLEFMIENNFKFDKLAVYVSAFAGNVYFVETLFQYQAFNDIDFEHLKKQLAEKQLYQMIDFFDSC